MKSKFKKFIVTTTINPPTKALKLFDAMEDWCLVAAGDLKTPSNFKLNNGVYLSPEDQEKMDKELSDAIGWNCIQRRNLGIIWAFQQGAEVVATVDDDNIPYPHWGNELYVGKKTKVNLYKTNSLAFDPLFVTNHSNLWHRGFPLQWLSERNAEPTGTEEIQVDVQADLWNGDPDIDAICRMEHSPVTEFKNEGFPFSFNKIAPFNSQNTFLSRDCLKDFFLFPKIGRMDDIWAAFWLQAKGYRIAFNKATVFQHRNPHDLTIDFNHELLGYTKSYKMIPRLYETPDSIFEFLPEGSKKIYELYQRHFL